jgi:hypothetical protein
MARLHSGSTCETFHGGPFAFGRRALEPHERESERYIEELQNALTRPSAMNVFISHSRADRAFAERLGSGIRALGAEVVSDESRLSPGESFDHALREALEASDGVVLVVPEPGTAQANSAFFEAGLRGR